MIEGLHGVPFARPRTRLRETVDVVRMALAGEKVAYAGETVTIPLPGGEGKPMRLSGSPCPDVPIYLATLSPRMLRLTGEIADGWLGTSFVPEAADAYLAHLDAGLAVAGRTRADLDVCQGAEVAFAADEDELARMIDDRRAGLAFSLGGMGSASTNFYFDAYARQGWSDGGRAGARALARGRSGRRGRARHRRDGAGHHADRHRVDGARPPAGVAGRRASTPCGSTRRGRRSTTQVATLGRAIELVREVGRAGAAG